MKTNAFCTARPTLAEKMCDRLIYCGDEHIESKKIEVYSPAGGEKTIYIPSMCDEDAFMDACDYIINNGVKAVVRAAFELDEAGVIEAKYKLSPIMLLHKLGVAGYCTVAGGVCLDNDDLDLMAQEGMALVLTPTASAGYGHGYAPVCAAIARGIRVGVGTFDGKYNPEMSIERELEFLRLTANAEMRCENALSADDLKRIAAFE